MNNSINRLPFSPLTHSELNRRVIDARGEAGGAFMALIRSGRLDQPYAAEWGAELVVAFDAYFAASLTRAGVSA